MWHELVLNGIGGRTIEEAQQNMSWSEFLSWAEYRQLRGSLHPGIRTDRGFARLAMLYANAHRDKTIKSEPYTIFDFMPHEEEPPISLEEAMRAWK